MRLVTVHIGYDPEDIETIRPTQEGFYQVALRREVAGKWRIGWTTARDLAFVIWPEPGATAPSLAAEP